MGNLRSFLSSSSAGRLAGTAAFSEKAYVAIIVRAGEICFRQNLAHSKSVDVALIVRAGEICFGQNLAHSKNEVKRICSCRGSNPVRLLM